MRSNLHTKQQVVDAKATEGLGRVFPYDHQLCTQNTIMADTNFAPFEFSSIEVRISERLGLITCDDVTT